MATSVNIETSDIISHHIQIISISNNNEIEVQLDLKEAPKKKKNFYIYQCGKEDDDDLAVIKIKRGKTSNTVELDLDEVKVESFKIALYENENDTNPISNILQIDFPNENINNTKPNNILLTTIKAIEHEIDDEKESKIYIY